MRRNGICLGQETEIASAMDVDPKFRELFAKRKRNDYAIKNSSEVLKLIIFKTSWIGIPWYLPRDLNTWKVMLTILVFLAT
jgi:hypothetical protein